MESQVDGSYKILNSSCNKYLRLESGSTADGANVGIKNDFGTDVFVRYIQEVPCVAPIVLSPQKCYQIINKATNKALEIKTTDPKEGAQIYQWSLDNNRSRLQQIWQIGLYANTTNIYGIK